MTATSTNQVEHQRDGRVERVPWLDGVRALAALYVVLHHIWLSVWPHYPDNAGPTWLAWLAPGQLGVVVFIVVSGYSLTMSPRRHGGRLAAGKLDFARRRAWRIMPPYIVALVLCTVLMSVRNGWFDGKSFFVHLFLLQDVVANTPPNGTFWSIAVEAQIYVFFPLMLLVARWGGPASTAALVTACVVVGHLLAAGGPDVFHRFNNVTPQLAACFVFGMWAAHVAPTLDRRRLVVIGRACALLLPVLLGLAWLLGTRRLIEQFFWVDLVVGLYAALCFLALGGSKSRTSALLASGPLRRFGAISYSSYLIHAPVIYAVWTVLILRLTVDDIAQFLLLLVVGVPAAIAVSYAFFALFEEPFLRIRSVAALRQHVGSRWHTLVSSVRPRSRAARVTSESLGSGGEGT